MTQQTERLNTALAGRYRIERHLGEGGMATVYLCEDLKHKRKVALKLLKPELAAVLGADRFVQEITTTAALQHPHILPLFDSGTADGFLFYVMPWIDGETLREKLNRETQLSVDEAVRIAREVADALDYAHQHGVVHRDVKPENILLHGGHAMVADFGIALAVSAAAGGRMTETGLSLGTPHYMSPEQATAEKEITARSDVYSLGSVLYEMLTGNAPFVGAAAQQIIMKIITEPAEAVTKYRKAVPANVAAAVAKSLEKLPADRFESAKAFAEALGNPAYTSATFSGRGIGGGGAAPSAWKFNRLTAAVSVLAAGLLGTVLWGRLRAVDPPRPVRFTIAFAHGQRPIETGGWPLAISPDGRMIVYAGETPKGGSQLYLRAVDELETRPLAGTDGAASPIFSPDGRTIAFIAAEGKLKRVPIEGGPPINLADVPGRNGLCWGPNDLLILGSEPGMPGLSRVPSTGGALEQFTRPDTTKGEINHLWPTLLPDGKTIVFTVYGDGGIDASHLAVTSLESGKVEPLDILAVLPLGLLAGRLVYLRSDGVVMAVPFDLSRRRATGPAVGLVEGIPITGNGNARVYLGAGGSLVYMRGGTTGRVTWVDDRGAARVAVADERDYNYPRLSPDGKRIALTIRGPSSTDIWIQQATSGTLTRLTTEANNYRAEWMPDGKRVLFYSTRGGAPAIWAQPADGSGPAERLGAPGGFSGVISPDSRFLLYGVTGTQSKRDLWVMPLEGDRTPRPFLVTPFNELTARIAPDGKWAAYASDESGRLEVYIRPFPGPGPSTQVSTRGGEQPVWARDGKRLFYVNASRLMVVSLVLGPTLTVGARDSLFEIGPSLYMEPHARYDVTPDGHQFLAVTRNDDQSEITVALNWIEEVRRRTAPGRR